MRIIKKAENIFIIEIFQEELAGILGLSIHNKGFKQLRDGHEVSLFEKLRLATQVKYHGKNAVDQLTEAIEIIKEYLT